MTPQRRPVQIVVVASLFLLLVLTGCASKARETASQPVATATPETDPVATTEPLVVEQPTVMSEIEIEDRLVDGYPCPLGRPVMAAVVTGVEDFANTRMQPSLESPIATQLFESQLVSVYPSTLTYDGSDHWWITVQTNWDQRCASIAADLLEGTFGNLADVLPGISFDLPTTGTWTFAERDSVFDRTSWRLEDSFATDVSIRILDGNRIDQRLAAQQRRIELDSAEAGFDFAQSWFVDEIEVPGSDRAVRYSYVGNGDSGLDVLLAEVGDFTVAASTSAHITDNVPNDELSAFLDSLSIDADTLQQTLTTPESEQISRHGNDYLVVREFDAGYNQLRLCGRPSEYYLLNDLGERDFQRTLLSTGPSELADGYLLWEIYCEGAEPVIFRVAQVNNDGSIRRTGSVYRASLGVRAEFGSHVVNEDGSVTFTGTPFGSDEALTDTFTLDELVDQLPAG